MWCSMSRVAPRSGPGGCWSSPSAHRRRGVCTRPPPTASPPPRCSPCAVPFPHDARHASAPTSNLYVLPPTVRPPAHLRMVMLSRPPVIVAAAEPGIVCTVPRVLVPRSSATASSGTVSRVPKPASPHDPPFPPRSSTGRLMNQISGYVRSVSTGDFRLKHPNNLRFVGLRYAPLEPVTLPAHCSRPTRRRPATVSSVWSIRRWESMCTDSSAARSLVWQSL